MAAFSPHRLLHLATQQNALPEIMPNARAWVAKVNDFPSFETPTFGRLLRG
jgi:hypothetical protein